MKKFASLFISLLISCAAFAQVTTSSISGVVTGEKNDPIPGTVVIAIHTPSGSEYSAAVDAKGNYRIQNMRPGGPYTVKFQMLGYTTAVNNGIDIALADNRILNQILKEEAMDIGAVVVTASGGSNNMSVDRSGSVTSINSRGLATLPTVTRSLNDFTRLTPQANGTSIGGGNYRQNFISIDGAAFNNNFGIGTNMPGNGSPISLDAIEQVSVNVTPYDVRQSGFIGAAINAVTRSGDNEFRGSVYTYLKNEKFKGNKVGDETFERIPSSYNMYGVRLGGPIVKNKLFFFVNYETEQTVAPGPSRVASKDGVGDYKNNIARPSESQMEMMSKYLSDTYGYQTGPYQGYSFNSPSQKILARIDWNINRNHKLNVRYSQMNSKSPLNPSTSTSPMSSLYTGNRQAMDAMWYQNSGYFQESNYLSISGEISSKFGNVNNKLRVGYNDQNEPRSTEGGLFPFVDILQDDKVLTSFGTEIFSYGNLRRVKTFNITDEVTWSSGINNFTAGFQADFNKTENGFQRYGTGYYVFNSWEDFVGGNKPKAYGITYPLTPGYKQAFPSFNYAQYSAYFQDEINVNDRFKVLAGLRLDLPSYPKNTPDLKMLQELTFNGGQKLSTSTLPKTRLMFSPRVGFNYDIMGDRSLVLRGGTGIFTGRIPFVWIVAQAGDSGMLQLTETSQANPSILPDRFNPDPRAYLPATPPTAGATIPSTLTIISDNFKMPQTWKTSIALDAKLPWGMIGTIEGIYNKDINTAVFRDANLTDPSRMNISGYPDNRFIYPYANNKKYINMLKNGIPDPTGNSFTQAIVLDNGNKGYYWSVTAKLEKTFNRGFSAMIAYTRSDAKNLTDGSGDQALSAWKGTPNVNGSNSTELGYASYIVPDKLIASLSYRKEYLKSMATSVSLFYQGSAQGRFSYTYTTPIVGDNGANNLIYVPKDASEITFVTQNILDANKNVIATLTPEQQSDAFFKYIEQDKYLRTRKGKYAERNGAIMPWSNQFDIKIVQDFFVNVKGKRNTIQVSLDIFNLGNLLNKNWGVLRSYNQNNILKVMNQKDLVAGGSTKPTFQYNPYNNALLDRTYRNNVSYSSTYSMQLGIRYIFN